MAKIDPPPPSTRISGVRADACLGFANTLSWRGRETPAEALGGPPELVRWAEAHAGLEAESALQWLSWAQQRGAEADALLRDAIALREALYRIFGAAASGGAIPAADLAALNRALAEAPERREVVPVGDRCGWHIRPRAFTIPALLAPVLWSAADLLVQGGRSRIRQCANEKCLWLFIDESKNGTRRWCDMASCGNRAKARRHYLKRKKV